MKQLACLALIIFTFSTCLASSPVGSWNGHLDMTAVKGKDAKEQAGIDAMKKMFSSMSLKMSFKADKTYTVTTSMSMGGPAKTQTESGKWTQSGQTVTVFDKKGKGQAMTLSANGKQMVMVPPAGDKGPKGLKIVFARS